MTEKEKEATWNLKELVQLRKDKTNTIKYDTCICSTKELNTALNLIQTQQVELERKEHEYRDLELKYNQNLKFLKHFREELQKQDKIIDLIADKLVEAHKWFYSEFDNYTKEDWKQYFEKQVERE